MEQQQELASSSMWIKGVIISINQQKQYGFIQSHIELPDPFTNRDVHFMLHKVSWNVQVNDNVEFRLDERKHCKPSAADLRLLEPQSSSLSGGKLNLSSYDSEKAASFFQKYMQKCSVCDV